MGGYGDIIMNYLLNQRMYLYDVLMLIFQPGLTIMEYTPTSYVILCVITMRFFAFRVSLNTVRFKLFSSHFRRESFTYFEVNSRI